MSEHHFLSFLHDGCALCGEEWPCRTVLLEQLAAERARAERAEAERDAAVKARLDWQADYDREKRQLHAMIDDARQRAEAAEAELAQYKPNPADDIGPCKRCDLTVSKWELLGVSEQKHDVCYALDLAEAKVATTAANAEKVAILLMETPTPADLEAATKRAEAAEGREARLRGPADAIEAWAAHVIGIVRDGRVPSADAVADGEAIIGLLRAALAGTPDPNERAAQLIQALPRDCVGCWRCQPESHPKPPGLKTRRAVTPEDLPATAPRESHPATICVTEVRRGAPTIHPDEIGPRDGTPEGER